MPSGENHFYVDNPKAGQLYSKLIGEELVWFTRRMFPLSHKREDTYIAGLSMGGYGALVNGLKYSETFGAIGTFSAALMLDRIAASEPVAAATVQSRGYYEMVFGDLGQLPGSDKDYQALALELLKSGKQPPKLYMAVGTEDTLYGDNVQYVEFLKENKIPVTFEAGPGHHDWDFRNSYILRFLNWLFPDYVELAWRISINNPNILAFLVGIHYENFQCNLDPFINYGGSKLPL